MSRRIVTKSEWARMHGWHPSNVSYLLKRGIITERPDGRLDLRQVEAQRTEHTGRPTLFRSVSDPEFMEARIRKMQWQTLIRETQIRRQLNLLVSRRDHRVKLSLLRDYLQHEIPPGNKNGPTNAFLDGSFPNLLRKIAPESNEFTDFELRPCL